MALAVGPKKIAAKLASDRPETAWPAASTIGDILKRQGMVTPRSARRRPLPQGNITPGADAPNDEWSIDFKGWFRTADGTRCDPPTIEDTASRYLIETRITKPDTAGVKRIMERVFRENGLPDAIRSDNGSPFGSVGAAGLSRLSVWWLKLGIEPRYIPPSSPQDNGRHERMHRTLKAETSKPPAATPKEQQARFDAFRTYQAVSISEGPACCDGPLAIRQPRVTPLNRLDRLDLGRLHFAASMNFTG